jgi:cytoplasmic iron level regulating protein YaaA (DUF328/UPF0246 family)
MPVQSARRSRLIGHLLASAAVLVLLPPSEGKTAPKRGKPLDLAALSHPELTAARERVLDALVALTAGPPAPALAALGLSEGQAGELERDAALRTAPTARASAIYTGVLFERLRLPELPLRARRRVLIASALWGVVRPDDRIPAYRLSMTAQLPGMGGLAAHWRPVLRAALPDGGLVVDLRSGPYAAAWTPKDATVVAVRAFTEVAGRRTAVSHMVKATRGDVARLLLEAPRPPRNAEQVAALVAASGREVELTTGRGGASLDVILRDGAVYGGPPPPGGDR